jgi:hypothetical protein
MSKKRRSPDVQPEFDDDRGMMFDGDLFTKLQNMLPANPADLCLFLGAALKAKDTPEGSLPSQLSEIGEQVEKHRPLINLIIQQFSAAQQQNQPKAKKVKVGVRRK